MWDNFTAAFEQVADRTGWVTWPLLVISVLAMAMIVERALFWYRTNRRAARRRLMALTDCVAGGDRSQLSRLLRRDRGIYASVLRDLMDAPGSEAVAAEAVERQRPRLERFMPALSTIITVCPMLGILGTVTGIIASFEAFARQQAAADLGEVSRGIAEALWSTAGGLTVTIIVLFPYNVFRAQLDRTLGRIEVMVAQVAQQQHTAATPQTPDDPGGSQTPAGSASPADQAAVQRAASTAPRANRPERNESSDP